MKGIYTLVFIIERPLRIKIGKLGIKFFKKGIYAYVGSGLGKGSFSMLGRIERHLKRKKKMFWHIDYLLSHKCVKIIEVFYAKTNFKIECILNKEIEKTFKGKIPIKGFGSSDCNCKAHLIWLGNIGIIKQVRMLMKKAYANAGLKIIKTIK
ncbi:MAG: GIY-YIG nuclease family protein [Candidatus Bathyarchaeia archaeon]